MRTQSNRGGNAATWMAAISFEMYRLALICCLECSVYDYIRADLRSVVEIRGRVHATCNLHRGHALVVHKIKQDDGCGSMLL
jgi:hypothetical protein